MKIAILTPGGVDRSGTERVIPCLLWLIERLARADEVHVFAWNQESSPGHWPLLGSEVHNAGRRPRALRLLAMLIAEHRKRPFDVVHAFWASPMGVIGATASRLFGIPLVLTLPGGDLARLRSIGYGGRLKLRGRAMVRLAAASAAAVTVPSHQMRAEAERAKIRADYVPLGVALDRWEVAPPRLRAPAAPVRLLHVGSLNRVKDQATLLDAAAILRRDGVRFELDVIGSDTLDGEVHRLVVHRGLAASVRVRGFLPHHALRPIYAWADILVVSSMHEAGPLVVLEAALAGLPCAGTAVGHVADFAPDAAIVVPVRDGCALAGAIARLAADEPLRLRLAGAAQRRALQIDADFTARRFRDLYDEAVCVSK